MTDIGKTLQGLCSHAKGILPRFSKRKSDETVCVHGLTWLIGAWLVQMLEYSSSLKTDL